MRQKQEISDLLLEQYVLGELPPKLARMVQEKLAVDASLRARHAAIEKSDRQILDRYPPSQIAGQIRQRAAALRQLSPARRRPSPLAIALPAAAAVIIAFSLFLMRDRFEPGEIRLKGLGAQMSAFLKTAQGARDLTPGSVVGKGDVIQLGYTAGEARYGVILSIDGRGTITWHMPAGFSGAPRMSPALEKQGQVLLPLAYELDDAPGFERFFFVSADKPFDVSAIGRAARALAGSPASAEKGDLSLAPGLRQSSLLLKKRDRGS